MNDESTEEQLEDTLFNDIANELWNNEDARKLLGQKYGIDTANHSLFRAGLENTIIRFGGLDDPEYLEYLESFLENPRDKMRGGSKKDRDNWFEWSGDEYAPFHHWVHRVKKPKLSPEERAMPFKKSQIQKWWDEWKDLPDQKKAMYEVEKMIE